MEDHRSEELRLELNELLRKQREVLDSRMLRKASEDELLEYEVGQESTLSALNSRTMIVLPINRTVSMRPIFLGTTNSIAIPQFSG